MPLHSISYFSDSLIALAVTGAEKQIPIATSKAMHKHKNLFITNV
jgi:hypothetical protein